MIRLDYVRGWSYAVMILCSGSAAAAPQTYVFDMTHSRLFFDYDHQGYSMMLGRFTSFSGEFEYDDVHPEASSLDVMIDPASVDVFDEELNERLKGGDFFDVASYPTMRFVSRQVIVTGENELRVDGELTMHGRTQSVSLEVHRNKFGINRQGHQVAGFSARGHLKRADFGMGFLAPAIAENVVIRIEIEAWPLAAGT